MVRTNGLAVAGIDPPHHALRQHFDKGVSPCTDVLFCPQPLLATLVTAVSPATAAPYPDRPVKIVVPYAPGGTR